MGKPEGQPIVSRGTPITVYPEWPGVVAAIRWNRYAGYTYGIRRNDDGRIFYVWESQVAQAMQEQERHAIEMAAARRAYAAGLGAGEWEAFLTDEQRARLAEMQEAA